MNRKLLNLCVAMLLSLVSTAAWALSEVGGVYQIGTADDLVAFAELVNGDNPYACAVLTADIVKPSTDVSMIGRDGQDFQGTFDGAGHTITIDLYSQNVQGTALFRNVGVHGIVQNLKVQGTITSNQKLAAGIAVWCNGIIRGCYVDVTVNSSFAGDATHGGIVAIGNRGLLIENCLAKFVIKGSTTQNCGGLVGWLDNPINAVNNLVISDGSTLDLGNNGSANIARNGGNVRTFNLENYLANPYANRPAGANANNYVTNQWGNNNGTSVVPYDGLADGQICYQLNTDQSHIAWVQRIGTDPFPVPAAFGTGQVYASVATDCDGKLAPGTAGSNVTYSNSGTVQATAHDFDKYGICHNCGMFNFNAFDFDNPQDFDQADRTLKLKSADDIFLCEGWNRIGDGFKLNMKMANDIQVTSNAGELIFNSTNWVDGNFNGDGHVLTIEMPDMTVNDASFIPKFTGIFENVIMHGTITTSGKFAGSITSHTYEDRVIIRNVFSDIDINCSLAADNTNGGLIGVAESKTIIENAIYAGNINGNGSTQCLAGFCGWSAGQTYWTNCAFLGTLNGQIGDSQTLSRNASNITCTNVYSVNNYSTPNDNGIIEEEGKFIIIENTDDIESGALAYALNGNVGGAERFYQLIGTDPMPMPIAKEGALVYASASSYRCDGLPLGNTTYSNTPASVTLPDHQFEEGFCKVCGSMDENYMTPVDGWFDISTPAQLAWWTNYAAKHLDVSARLTADIDFAGYSGLDSEGNCTRWANVGTEGAPFYGNFDGQFHIISNLKVYHPGDNGVGLIAVMNSLPSKGFGGLNDEQARNAEGVYIKNVVLDESCSLTGRGYVALVGMTAPWAGHVNIQGVMMCGDVTANGGPNAAGVFGCVMSSACHVTIDNCGMVGDVYGPKENGSFSGWLGDWAEVTNCFAVGEVEGIQVDNGVVRYDRYFARFGNDRVKFTNCYALHGTQVPTVTQEDFESGALAWKANGEQFRTSYWYQTIGDDQYPFPDPSHGTVVFAAEQYFSIVDEADIEEVAPVIEAYELGLIEEIIATQDVIDACTEAINILSETTTILELADALDSLGVKKAALEENAAVYRAYIAKCEEIIARLADDDTFQGDLRDALEYYLDEYEEPTDENPLGTYDYIKTEHLATAEEVAAETARVDQWLKDAIAEDYQPGTEVSNLLVNGDFSQEKEGWTGAWSTGYGSVNSSQIEGAKVVGVEAWNVTGDQYQTVEGMKPGYYLIGTHAAFRPSNNRYSTNYAAGIYANGIFNYFPTVIEDPVDVDEAVDQVNCNLNGAGAHDLNIYDDGYSTSGEDSIGFVVHGETGMAAAANAGRYQVYTYAYVGEDGKLTVGIKNPGTKYGNDWTGWSAIKVTYLGEEADDALDLVLENMAERANTILLYEYDDMDAEAAPNFPAELLEQLDALVSAVGDAETVADKASLAKDFSDAFQAVYEGKQTYIALHKLGAAIEALEGENPILVEKDEETDEWMDTDEFLFTDEEIDNAITASAELLGAYEAGEYSVAQAQQAIDAALADFAGIFPARDQEGTFLITTPKELAGFRIYTTFGDSKVNAKVVNDIDMYGISMLPICTSDNRFRGTFDGQAHAINNLYINNYEQRTGLFNSIDAATVKNLKLTGEYYSGEKFIGGITGYTYGNSLIENCDVAVKIYSTVDGDGTHGGLIGVNETEGTVVNNCLVNCPMYGEDTNSCGGVVGWATNALTVKNTLILSQGSTIDTSNGCNTISRNDGNCTVSNVYYVEPLGTANGTKVDAAQLASGEIAYRLNGSKSENVAWFQTLGTDANPHLFDGDVVYYYGGQYVNDKPNPQLNAFAYALQANKASDRVIVTFKLNAEAESAEVRFSNGYTKVVEGELKAGTNRVNISLSDLGADPQDLTYEVAVTSKGSLDILQVGESYKFNSPYGLDINNNPASKNFGQVLITESRPTENPEGMFSTGTPGALFAFDAAFKPVGSYYGGLDIAGETEPIDLYGAQLDLKDIRFSKDGRLFVARASGTSNSSVYEINPDDLDEDWTPVFTEGELDEATGITYVGSEEQNRPAVGLAVEGEGESLRLYVLGAQGGMEAVSPAAFNCAFYDLGVSKQYNFSTPSGYITALDGQYAAITTHIGIHEDGQGGLWFIQSASTRSEEIPAIKHFNAAGEEDYSDPSTNTHSGKIAVSADGDYLAIAQGSNKVVVYENSWVIGGNGRIILTPRFNISTTENNITGLAFDYAGNLYAASSGTKTLSRYTLPYGNKVVVTPGNGVSEAVFGDVNNDGSVDGGDCQQILNVMSVDGYDAKCDVNGNGIVDGADYQQVLNIMSAQ